MGESLRHHARARAHTHTHTYTTRLLFIFLSFSFEKKERETEIKEMPSFMMVTRQCSTLSTLRTLSTSEVGGRHTGLGCKPKRPQCPHTFMFVCIYTPYLRMCIILTLFITVNINILPRGVGVINHLNSTGLCMTGTSGILGQHTPGQCQSIYLIQLGQLRAQRVCGG